MRTKALPRGARGATDATAVNTIIDMDTDESSDREVEVSSEPAMKEGPGSSVHQHPTALGHLLSKNWNFGGLFAYKKAFADAPNPNLIVNGLGIVGLPLGPREATAMKTVAIQNSAEDTVGQSGWRGAWKVNGSMVRTANESWIAFLDNTVEQVCQSLGIRNFKARPERQLHRLILLEKGSCLQPCVEASQVPGAFATMTIMLPTSCAGGAFRITHGDNSRIYESEAAEFSQTMVLAYYLGATHEMDCLTDGYRLMLVYHLIDTSSSIPPAVSHDALFLKEIESVLTAWKDDTNSPEKIVYLLDTTYTEKVANANDLQPTDAHLARLLGIAGSTLGFCVGLATIRCVLEGRGYPRWEEIFGKPPVGGQEWEVIYEREVHVEELRSLEGHPICASLSCVAGEETIPTDLSQDVEKEQCHDESWDDEYIDDDPYTGGKQIFNRTALVIWRPGTEIAIKHVSHSWTPVCISLSRVTSETSQAVYENGITAAFEHCSEDPAFIADSLCRAAVSRNDADLWSRAVATCGKYAGLEIFVDEERLRRAISAFGFEAIQTALSVAVQNDSQDIRRLKFLNDLDKWAAECCWSELVVKAWTAVQGDQILNSLHVSDPKELDALLELVIERGSVEYLKNSFIPTICDVADGAHLLKLSEKIGAAKALRGDESLAKILSHLATAVVSKTPLDFLPKQDLDAISSASENIKYLLDCLKDSDELRGVLLAKVSSQVAGSNESESLAPEFLTHLVPPVLTHVVHSFSDSSLASPHILPSIRRLLEMTLQHPPLPPKHVYSVKPFEYSMPSYDESLKAVISKDCLWELFESCVSADIAKNLYVLKCCISVFCTRFESEKTPPASKATLLRTFIRFLKQYLDLPAVRGSDLRIGFAITSCIQMHLDSATFSSIFAPVISPTKDRDHLEKVLLPLLPKMVTLATMHGAYDTLGPTVQTIVTSGIFVRDRLTRKTTVRNLTAEQVAHVKQLCDKHLPPSVKARPVGLSIEILISGPVVQRKDSPAAETLTAFLEQDSVARRLLGPQYDRVMTAVKGSAHTPTSAVSISGSSLPPIPPPAASTSSSSAHRSSASAAREPGEIRAEDGNDRRPTKRQKMGV
ncbi:hypothetical protein EIP91_000336 [Steccherinum ochraceum]|uniref:Uncharacterized protein n=1 Tax=Steccherinum ochraceum TaxID=92696 RepID=A0A4R0RPJ7_9APHY|nr:hypothetical protein EIP91_000336 [Steccherinum ochraceum]